MMTGRTFWLYTTVTLAGGAAGGRTDDSTGNGSRDGGETGSANADCPASGAD